MEGYLMFAVVALLILLGCACSLSLYLLGVLIHERDTRKLYTSWHAQAACKLSEIRTILDRKDD